MKPHLVVELRDPPREAADVPFWGSVLRDKSAVRRSILPKVEAILSRHGRSGWVTREHQSAGAEWSPLEARHGLDRLYRIILRENQSIPASLIDQIRLLPEVSYVGAGRVAEVELPVAQQHARLPASHPRRARERIGLSEAHLLSKGDPRVVVAVLDTGMNSEHPELRDALRLDRGYDFVDIIDGAKRFFIGDFKDRDSSPEDLWVGHGTHVAGIISGKGIAMPMGVVPRCRLINVRVLAALKRPGELPVGAGLVDNINVALKWTVDQGVDVVNMSLGIPHEGGGRPYESVVDYAASKGTTIVAASGNNGGRDLYYPGALPYVIAVSALDDGEQVAAFSTYGRQVDLAAPGTAIYSSFLKDERTGAHGYAWSSGTSQAAPFVTGAVAMLKSRALHRGRALTDAGAKEILERSSDKLDRRYRHPKAGYGRLNLPDALTLLDHSIN